MMECWIHISILLTCISAVVINAQFNPHKDPNICGRPTCNGVRKFNYSQDVSYSYQYSVNVKTLFSGSSKNESSLHIVSQVAIHFRSACDAVLSISDVKLSEFPDTYDRGEDIDIESPEHAQSAAFAEDLSRNTLRFAFHDGVISEVCPEDDEPNWVLNFKRGLLSMFQNTMQRFDVDYNTTETDVNGVCQTGYLLQGAREASLVINKYTDIASCQRRYKHHSILQTTLYSPRSINHQISLMKSSSQCEITIDHSIYSRVECTERHMFQPFSNHDAGATTITKQSLKLFDEILVSPDDAELIRTRTSLLYDHFPTPKPTSGELRNSRDMLKDMCKFSKDDIQIEFSEVFSKFMHYARLLSYSTLSTLYNRAAVICPSGKKHVLDALPFLGCDASVQLMADIITKKGVPHDTITEWMTSFAFIPRPTPVMLETLLNLLKTHQGEHKLALSVSSMAHTYCKVVPDCENDAVVQQIINELEGTVAKTYRSRFDDRAAREKLLIHIKALANLGLTSDSFKVTIREIINDADLAVEVRIAAIDMHRRTACDETQTYFMKIFRDMNADSELRIAAYLQSMRCPSYAIIQEIRQTLNIEEVNQVGSFVWTHLRNLLKSSVPSHVEIQGLLSDKDLGRKFSSDIRKFSHNYEGSLFFEEYNTGGNYEMNTIFSPDSYFPRTFSLNLTVDLFGESINLFELTSRMEGFENYLESLFGPNRTYSAKNLKEKFSNYRLFRSADDTNVIKSQVSQIPNVIDNNFNHPKVAVGVKVFGNQLSYNTFIGDKEISDVLQKINPINYLKQILSGKEIAYSKAAVFLDTSYIVPTGTGLPIILNAAGTSALNLKMSGSLRAVNFMQNHELDLKGYIRPSLAVDVIGTMSVDAYYASTGIKVKTNLYSSSAVEGDIKIRGTKLVGIKFKLPKNKTEIFGAQSELIVMKNDKEEFQTDVTKDPVSRTICTWPVLDNTIGLKMCTYYKYPNGTSVTNTSSNFFFHGPSKMRVYVEKADPTADTYLLEYNWQKSETAHVFSLVFDTPNSRVNRAMVANLTLNMRHRNLTLLLKSRESTFLATGNYKNTPDEKKIDLSLDVNGKKHFKGELGYHRTPNKHGFTYFPKFYLSVNTERIANLSGSLKWVTKKNVSQCDVDLNFETKKLTTKLFGYISKTHTFIDTNLKLNYRFGTSREETVKTHFKIGQVKKTLFKSITGDLRLDTTAYPNLNFVSSLKYQKASGHIECKIEINNGPNMQNETNKLTILSVFSCYKTHNGTKLNTFLAVTKPANQLDLKFQVQYAKIAADINMRILARYAEKREIMIVLYVSMPTKTLFEFDMSLNVTLPSFTPMLLDIDITEKSPAVYEVGTKGTWFSGHSITAKGLYYDRTTTTRSDHDLKVLVKSPSFTDIIADARYYRDNKDFKIIISAKHNKDEYSFLMKHSIRESSEIATYGEIRYKAQIYTLMSTVDLREKRQIILELHIDQLRDIYVALKEVNLPNHKSIGGEIKWDSNRDPSQKLIASIAFTRYEAYNTSGNFLFSYPGRAINGFYALAIKDTIARTSGRIAWSPKDIIDLTLNSDFKSDNDQIYLSLESELLTPFETWEKTSFNGGIHHRDNLYRINGSVYWRQDQYIAGDLCTNYLITPDVVQAEFNSSLVSTIQDIPSIACSIKHYIDDSKLNSDLYIMYNPKQVLSIQSSWFLEREEHRKNLTGTVSLSTPFEGYQKGVMQSKITFTDERNVFGFTSLDLDSKHYSATCEGRLKRLFDSSFVFNITTPIEKYKQINGRFGFSDEKRHAVAFITYPTGAVGIEVLFQLNSLSDFNILLNVETPLDFLTKLLVIGKLKPQDVDFRAGWNKVLVGFSGVWRFQNNTDFEYAYKLFTPLEGIEENGVVARFIYNEGLDLEVSMRLAKTKLGVTIYGQPKPKLLKGLGLQPPKPFLLEERKRVHYSDEDDSDENKDDEYGISWTTKVEVDSAIYPTIKGTFDIDEVGSLYTLLAMVSVPEGTINLRDEFYFEDVFTINNRLLATTPYAFNQITSNVDFEVDLGRSYLLGADFNLKKQSEWLKTGFNVLYTLEMTEDDESETHIGNLNVHTPFANFPRLSANGKYEIEENHYRGNVSLNTSSTHIALSGILEKDDGFLETALNINLTSPYLNLSSILLTCKKDFSEIENTIELGLDMLQLPNQTHKLEIMWTKPTEERRSCRAKIITPLPVLRSVEIYMLTEKNVAEKSAFSALRLEYNEDAISLNGSLKNDEIHVELLTFSEAYRHVFINLKQEPMPQKPGYYNLRGQLATTMGTHNIGGLYVLQNDSLVFLKLSSQNQLGFEYKLTPHVDGYGFSIILTNQSAYANVTGKLEFKHKMDWNFQLETASSYKPWDRLGFESEVCSPTPNNITMLLNTALPIPQLAQVKVQSNLLLLPENAGIATIQYDLRKYTGVIKGHWNWLVGENMQIKLLTEYLVNETASDVTAHIFYVNPKGNLHALNVGGDFSIDKNKWAMGSNASLAFASPHDIDGEFNLKLPKPYLDTHTLRARYDNRKAQLQLRYLLEYTTEKSRQKYGASGAIMNQNRSNFSGNLKLEWGPNGRQYIDNKIAMKTAMKRVEFNYGLVTPKFSNQDTFVTKLRYGRNKAFHNLIGKLYYPESRSIFDGEIDYAEFSNMNGTFNSSTPFAQFPYIGAHFITETKLIRHKRYIEVFWPNETALLDALYSYTTHRNDETGDGSVLLEIPLATRHTLLSKYGHSTKKNYKDGFATISYNKVNFLDGKYNCRSQSRAGFEKNEINIEVENKIAPLGVLYVHQIETDIPRDGFIPITDFKRAEIFKLHNRTGFNITGELNVKQTRSGQDIKLMAHHMNRTVLFNTDYSILDQRFLNKAKLQLSPQIWLGYDIDLINKTFDSSSESQQIQIELSYPRRNVTTIASYNMSAESLASQLSLSWGKQMEIKNVEAALNWKHVSVKPNHQELTFELRHPSFEKNVTFLGVYRSDKINLADVKLEVEYALDLNRKLNLHAILQDHCKGSLRNYTFGLFGTHPATRLDLMVKGGVDYHSKFYHTYNTAKYKRTYLPLQSGESSATLDIRRNEIELKKATQRDLSYLWTRYDGKFPVYTMNASVIHGQDINATGEFYLNLIDKLIRLEGNRTPEATQSVHMYGNIPNARSAFFNFWRNYEDIRISDISYYLQLNHSRLITSKLLWRPQLKSDIKSGFLNMTSSMYETVVEYIDYWKQYIRSEAYHTMQDIWSNATPLVQGFLDDMNDLNVLEEDAEQFKAFINESYHNNEFYVKNIIDFAYYIVDELSIRDHIESVPDIVNEVWEIMGDSGQALRKSLIWLIETIKKSYKKAVEFLHEIMKGDALDHISKMMEYFIQKYDNFIKDLHVAFIKYVEKLWTDLHTMIVNHWNRMLGAIEPTVLKFLHYAETVLWSASKEFLEFLYKRKHEIEGSPYFAHVANFTQDVDRFYKDMINNNIITNVRKYSAIVWKFIKEKYFTIIPFGKELHSVFNEIVTELNELKKLPSIQFVIQKYDELHAKLMWMYDYFEIGDYVQKIISILHMKLTEITQTALESENKYREAKTKFVYDPVSGIMELEQKLPMSWHAFNETPKFQEIPEIKAINDIQNYVIISNHSFWMLYYQYKPYTEPTTWVPPFDAYAMLIGNQHYLTFDGKHYDFAGSCSYLLARDFLDKNFTVYVSYDHVEKRRTHKVNLLVDDLIIQIDLFADTVKLLKTGIITRLPLQLTDVYIYQDNDVVTVDSVRGFTLTCNLKFDICKFHVSGWYFGKTAGLWGTMNNEPRDDFLTAAKTINSNIGRFAQSWALEPKKCRTVTNHATITTEPEDELKYLCDALFRNKISPLSTCFPIVDATPFWANCQNTPNGNNRTACVTVMAYIEACKMENTPLRIPENCIQCSLINGTEVPEGRFLHLEGPDVPQSADVVFIIEAKECNANITTKRYINHFVSIIHKELTDLNLTQNKYAVVVFGGAGVYDKPRTNVVNNEIFATHQKIPEYFENIPTGNGSSDIYNALSFAKNLVFRPGVSKTFILLPCSDCQAENMKLDYTVLHQLLRENDIRLHILMNGDFVFPKARVNKIFFGIDRNTSYTKKDVKELKGDAVLRRQVKLPKTDLGDCAPLALETNGSVFSATKMEHEKRGMVKKFATVFAKRVAQSAVPNSCQSCECTATSVGTSYMECLPCTYPSAVYIDYGFNEDEMLSILQPMDFGESLEDDLED